MLAERQSGDGPAGDFNGVDSFFRGSAGMGVFAMHHKFQVIRARRAGDDSGGIGCIQGIAEFCGQQADIRILAP